MEKEIKLKEYASWTDTTWVSSIKKSVNDPKEQDLMVMSMGLPGEGGEVLEVILNGWVNKEVDFNEVKKELGDFIYYWVRLCKHFDANTEEVLGEKSEDLTKYSKSASETVEKYFGENNGNKELLIGLKLAVGYGKLSEMFKKRIRDDFFDKEKFTIEMKDVFDVWCAACKCYGFKPSEVMLANQEKIMNRKKNKTLRGSGNNR